METKPLAEALDRARLLAAAGRASNLTDAALLDRFVTGTDEAAFAALVERHGAMVYGVCARLLRNPHDAEDACQATYLVLARKASAVRNRSSVASWLHGVARRVSLTLLRARAERQRRERGAAAPEARSPEPAGPLWSEVQVLLDEELERLPERLRGPLVLCYLEGKTRDEAAAALGLTPGRLHGLLQRGRVALRDRLVKRGVALGAGFLAAELGGGVGLALPPTLAVWIVNGAVAARTGQELVPVLARAETLSLTNEVLRVMFYAKVKAACAWVACVGVALALVGAVLASGGAQPEGNPVPKADERKRAPQKAPDEVPPKTIPTPLRVFRPAEAERTKPGTGKFVIFTREDIDKTEIAGAWECIPSQPKTPITKRAEFGPSGWTAGPLVGLRGPHARFVRLQVPSDRAGYTVNLYDINYRTWDVRYLSQGKQLLSFGVLGDSIFCYERHDSSDGWQLLDATTGKLSKGVPFIPFKEDGPFWLVRKPGETTGLWSYNTTAKKFVAHFGDIDPNAELLSEILESRLSPDGKQRTYLQANAPAGWRGGALPCALVLQRDGEKKDLTVPVEVTAEPGSGWRYLADFDLSYTRDGKVQLRSPKAANPKEAFVWTIDIAKGTTDTKSEKRAQESVADVKVLHGVPVPEYLRKEVGPFAHFGAGGIAPAFLTHLGILKDKLGYSECSAGVSPDGRHILFVARKGPLKGEVIYGDLVEKTTVRWKSDFADLADIADIVWVVTP